MRLLRAIYRLFFASGVRYGNGFVLEDGAGIANADGDLHRVFAPPLFRVILWIGWLRSKEHGGVMFTAGGETRMVRTVKERSRLSNVPGRGCYHVHDMTPDVARRAEEVAQRHFSEKRPRVGRMDLN